MVETDNAKGQLGGNTNVAKYYKAMGFKPKHPVALFNSLSGNVIEVVESTRKPDWVAKQPDGSDGGALWVDVGKVAGAAVGNITGVGHTNTATARVQRWHDELIHMMDSDQDGDVDTEELLSFLTETATLKNDQLIQKVRAEAEGKTTLQLLKELGPCMPKVLSALVESKSKAGEQDAEGGGLSSSTRSIAYNWEASTEFAKHMQLKGGWMDPDGVKVRARSGLEAMECLVANDPGGLMAKLGAALMLPVTSALRDVGYEEGKTMRGYGYDWRVPCTKLEEREQYLSKTMEDITELVASNNGEKAVVITHSLGGVMASYFFHWVAHSDYGKARGGPAWLEKHIHSFCPIGGPLLGTPYGSHSYITGDEGQGLAPGVFSYPDRHLVVRSWGMFGMIFPTGRHLMLQPTNSVHWIRRQGCLNVHVLTVDMKGENVKEDTNQQYYVMAGFKEPSTGNQSKKLKCTPIKFSTSGAIDEQLLFFWETGPESFVGGGLTISLWRDWVGPVDKEFARGTFDFDADSVTVAEGPAKGDKLPALRVNNYVDFKLPLKEKTSDGVEVTITVRLRVAPFDDKVLCNDFRRSQAEDPGAFRCGGLADAGSSQEKRDRLLQALGPEQGKEWRPEAKKDPAKITYAPMSIDEMMVLDEMEENYKAWKECYADDPIWRKHSTEPPEGVKRIRPIYGINVPTLVGNVYRRQNKRIARYQPNTALALDADCDVKHPGYKCKSGIVEETPHKSPQADDPTKPMSEMTFNTKASGDGTVAYWSLRWPITWKNRGYDVKNIEVEAAGHRDILEKIPCLETCLSEACSPPVQYVEIVLRSVTFRSRTTCLSCCFNCCCCCLACLCNCMGLGTDTVFVGLEWHGTTFYSEPVEAEWCGGEREIFEQRRFVLGVTQKDLDEDASVELSIRSAVQASVSMGPVADGTKVVPYKISDLFKVKQCDGPQEVEMGSNSGGHKIKWTWRWSAANDAGQPTFK